MIKKLTQREYKDPIRKILKRSIKITKKCGKKVATEPLKIVTFQCIFHVFCNE